MRSWIKQYGTDDREALINFAYGLSSKYGEAAAELACQMYDATATVQKAKVPPAEPAQPATYPETAKAVNGAMLRGDAVVPQVVERLVKQAGQDTTLNNAIRDGAEWAWVPQGDTCAFCITLASNGWQKASKKVLNGNHAKHIHANCDCAFTIRFDGESGVDGYDPEEYRQMYYGADGIKPNDKINAMRRDIYPKIKDERNLRRRQMYAQEKIKLKEKFKQQAELLSKYGDENSLMLFGDAKDIERWASLKKEVGFDLKKVQNEILKDTDSWEGILNNYTDKFRNKLSDLAIDTLNDTDIAALRAWTGPLYSDINRFLRYGVNVGDEIKQIAKNIEKALNKLELPETIIAKRGVEKTTLRHMFPDITIDKPEDIEKLIGKTFPDKGFFATTPHPQGGLGGGVKMFVKVPKGTKGGYIEKFAYNEREYELLLQKGYSYRVINAKTVPNKYFKNEKDIVLWIEVII